MPVRLGVGRRQRLSRQTPRLLRAPHPQGVTLAHVVEAQRLLAARRRLPDEVLQHRPQFRGVAVRVDVEPDVGQVDVTAEAQRVALEGRLAQVEHHARGQVRQGPQVAQVEQAGLDEPEVVEQGPPRLAEGVGQPAAFFHEEAHARGVVVAQGEGLAVQGRQADAATVAARLRLPPELVGPLPQVHDAPPSEPEA